MHTHTGPDVVLVHISDLHFAREIHPPGLRGRGAVHPGQPGLLQGFYPHDLGACRELGNAVRSLFLSYPSSMRVLVASGDLTVSGDDSELALALSFLKRDVAISWHGQIGLRADTELDLFVATPGNHDHWRGRLAPAFLARTGPSSGIHGTYFPTHPRRPWFHRVIKAGPPGTGFQLQLMGVDSSGGSAVQWAARGALPAGAIADLKSSIATADQEAVREKRAVARILVTHHSLSPGGGPKGALHAFDTQSATELGNFLSTHRVHAVLTGHTHSPELSPTNVRPFGVELRSGTTLQARRPPALPDNAFLIHRIAFDQQDLVLKSAAFVRVGRGPFKQGAVVRRTLQQ